MSSSAPFDIQDPCKYQSTSTGPPRRAPHRGSSSLPSPLLLQVTVEHGKVFVRAKKKVLTLPAVLSTSSTLGQVCLQGVSLSSRILREA